MKESLKTGVSNYHVVQPLTQVDPPEGGWGPLAWTYPPEEDIKKEGVKDFKGKLRWSLLPFEALEGCIRVLMYGAMTKYAPDNWKKVEPQGVYIDATMRHLIAYLEGEEFDEETEESHLAHILCDILFLEYNRLHRNKDISFKDYLTEILQYDDYTKAVSQEEVDKKYGRKK